MDKLLNFLGLCRRAGQLIIGNDAAVDTVIKGNAAAVLTASDISANTEKKLKKTCEANKVKLIKLNRTKDEISFAVGRFAAVASVTDSGFARNIETLNETGGNRV